jgi:molecular chaperone IbpA
MLLLEDVVMRTYDFSPLFRSTVGFDRLFDRLNSAERPDWPPYNIEKLDEDHYRISMALAGFLADEIELVQQGASLTVSGHKKAEQKHEGMLHHGLAFRSFRQAFSLADHVRVTSATLENGMLCIDLVREVPEPLKPRRIEVSVPAATLLPHNNRLENQESGPRAAA